MEIKQPEDGAVLRYSVRPIRRDETAMAMLYIEDVTQQRAADDARNAFVTQATHELRTPLTNMRLHIETALEEGEADPALRAQSLNVINAESRRLERIVSDMLNVAQIEAGSLELAHDDVRLEDLFAHLATVFRPQAEEKQITLTFNLPPKLPVLQGDRDKIMLAVHNLVGNALKYTPENGQVTATVDAGDRQLTVEVRDTGFGIAEEDQQHLFEKFYRAQDRRVVKITGSGLGLALAREVIRLHGGDITVQSQLDKGSTFVLTLPV
jgi:signal transduction histidine kinase